MKTNENLKYYLILSYLMFWFLLALTGYLISLEVPVLVQSIMKNVCAWTPTFAILIMFRKLYPCISFRAYFAANFRKRIRPLDFLLVFILQTGIIFIAVMTYLARNNIEPSSLPMIGAAGILPAFIITLTSGATGEELGWRGYLLNIFQIRYSPLKSALFVGLIWGFWHLPLWIISGYAGFELFLYSIFFLLAILSFSVLITFFYNKSGNILIAMWMHFLFNFLLQLVLIEQIQLLMHVSVGYMLAAIIIVLLQKKSILAKPGIDSIYTN
jgi:membrane protease YdiL (CAAX protease family)